MMEAWRAWWFEAETEGRGRLFRFVFFAVLALDCWMMLPHLARYGAGHFNVSHLAFLDAWLPAPPAALMVGVMLACGWLALRVAFGVAVRASLSALAVLYALFYFSSQLDSYQHHYLVALLLMVLAASTWLEGSQELPDWSLKLTRALLAIMYFWAGITKLDPLWIDGRTLQLELTSELGKSWILGLSETLGAELLSVYAMASVAALVLELVLPVMLLIRRWRWLTCVVGVLFHASIEVLDFKIGLFSYFMVGIYLSLMLPDGLLPRVPRWSWGEESPSPTPHRLGVVVAAGALAMVPVEGVAVAALLVLVVGFAGPSPGRRLGMLQGIMGLGGLLLFSSTELVRDYWKYKGGDARRRADLAIGVDAYERVTALDPEYLSGWVRLGDLYLRLDRIEDAETAYRRAEALDPTHTTVQTRLRELRAHEAAAD